MAEKQQHQIRNLDELFVDVLKDLYDAESQITKALPKMVEHATSPDLKAGFQEHLEMTKRQRERLDQIFTEMKMSPEGKKCMGMQGLIKEGSEVMTEVVDPYTKDAALIAAAQKIEHYEISGYGTARTYAQQLGHQNIAQILESILKEEEKTDKRLTKIAEGHINARAKK